MRAVLPLLLLVLAVSPATRASAADAGAPAPPPPAVPACVRISTDARWVPYGYNHIVVIENGCSKAATCKVSTDVNPGQQTVEVEPTRTVEVTTIMGSPASQFVANVRCNLR